MSAERVNACRGARHWPLRIALGLLRAATKLPLRWQMVLGGALGDVARYAIPARRRVAQINVAHAFPTLTPAARRALVRATFRATGRSLLEAALAWWAPAHRFAGIYRIDGLAHLRAAETGGRGVILLGGHYTTLELSGRLLARHVPAFWPIFKPPRNRCMTRLMTRYRCRHFAGLVDSRDFRAMVKHLKAGRILWYAPDQDFGPRFSVFAPFLGVPTATLEATARLARLSGAPVLPFYSQRMADGRYQITIDAPLDGFPSGDAVADATAVNRAIETQVRAAPEQYLWVHKRFRTRPPGMPRLYPK